MADTKEPIQPDQAIAMSTKRTTRSFVWIDPEDCDPPHGLDMDNSDRDRDKVERLRVAFATEGFDPNMPALVGYPLNGRIQLLSGTHRHLAAMRAGIDLPVTLWLESDVAETFGTPLWLEIMRDIPVRELETYGVKDGPARSPYEAIIPERDFVT